MPQTKFVLSKALKQGLKPIVVINKLDKADQRANEVLDETFDLFVSLDANEEQLDFPVLYASGRSGWADTEVDGPRENLNPLLDLILDHVQLEEINYGYDFTSRAMVDVLSSGIIDPARVTRCALQNAVSVAGILITSNYAIIEV